MQMIHCIDRRSERLVRYVPIHSLVIVFVKSVIAKESSSDKQRSRVHTEMTVASVSIKD
jgi:hypothetical protein